MPLIIEPIEIKITAEETCGTITMRWVNEGVAEISLSNGFFIDEHTINQLTPVILEAFKELMK